MLFNLLLLLILNTCDDSNGSVRLEPTLHHFAVHLALIVGSNVTEKQLSIHVVAEDKARVHSLVRQSTPRNETLLGSENLKEDASRVVLRVRSRQLYLVVLLQDSFWDSVNDKGDRGNVILHRIDWQNTTAHHLCLGVGKGGENETWTIAQAQVPATLTLKIQSLEVLGLTGHGGNSDAFATTKNVDNR